MSFGSRLRECRINRGLSRNELASKLGVTASAIANYENEISTPKADILFLVFDALNCDANYLFQDEMSKNDKFILSKDEEAHIKKYRLLDQRGQQTVLDTLYREYSYLHNKVVEMPFAARNNNPAKAGKQSLHLTQADLDRLGEDIRNKEPDIDV